MKHVVLLLFCAAAVAPPAAATPYWYTYEGNELPEDEGWERFWGNDDGAFEGEGSIRTLENGVLTMDSMYSLRTYDYACHYLYGTLDPDPGELFVAEWRVMIEESVGDVFDSTILITTDEVRHLSFGVFPDHIESEWENVSLPIAPDVFHDYRVESWDMQAYNLYIDGMLVHQGSFSEGWLESKFAWGDAVRGASSLAQWDYVRFGVIPEPNAIGMLSALCVLMRRGRA